MNVVASVRKNKGKILLLFLLLGLVGFLVSQRFKPKPVTVTPVARGTAIDAVYATGTVEAEDRMTVKAKASGSVAEVFVKEGSPVKKGDLLARIDNPGSTFELKRGKADLSAANAQATGAPQVAALISTGKALEAELDVAKKNLSRVSDLHKGGALPKSDLDMAESRVRQVEAQISANRSQQQALRIDLTANAARQAAMVESLESRVLDTEVRCPQDGVVLGKLIEVGEVVTVNQALFRVGDTSKLVLEVMIDEADVAKVSDGSGTKPASVAAISLYAYPGQTFTGTVFEILPDANRDRKAFLGKIRFETPPSELRSGMSAEVNVIAGRKEGVLLAPQEAEAEGFVWVASGGRAEKRAVKVGMRDLLRFEVQSGLEEGDQVIVEGQKALAPGTRVLVTERTMAASDPVPDRTQPQKAP